MVLRVRYVTQASTGPPTFVVFVRGGQKFNQASERFVQNALRREFGFAGVPIRVLVRTKHRGGGADKKRRPGGKGSPNPRPRR